MHGWGRITFTGIDPFVLRSFLRKKRRLIVPLYVPADHRLSPDKEAENAVFPGFYRVISDNSG